MNFAAEAAVGVIIPVHNAMDHLPRSLEVLRAMKWPEAMVIVVDDGSTDGTSEFLKTHPEVRVVHGSGELWWSGAVEIGCRVAIDRGADILILWNDDNISASENCIHELATFVGEAERCAVPVVLGERDEGELRVVSAGGGVEWLRGGIPLLADGVGYDALKTHGPLQCQWLPGTALAFRKHLFLELGGFDVRRFPQYRGDADFTLRATARGMPCAALPSCWVVNDQGRTGMHFRQRVGLRQFVEGLISRRSSYQLTSTLRFYARHCPRRYLVPSIGLFYAKYIYATLKTWRRSAFR